MAQFKIALRRYVLIEAENFEEAIKIAKGVNEIHGTEVNYEESQFINDID